MPQSKIQILNNLEHYVPEGASVARTFVPSEYEKVIVSGQQLQRPPTLIKNGPLNGKYISKPLEDGASISFIVNEILATLPSDSIEQLLSDFFKALKQHIETMFPIAEYGSCGATCTVALQTNSAIYTAYVGDSEVFVITTERPENKAPIVKIQRLTEHLHHASDPAEQQRIFQEGGSLNRDNNRLIIPDKLGYPLALSRAISNAPANSIPGLSFEPEIVRFDLEPTQKETTLIACSDGFVDYLGGEEACIVYLWQYFNSITQDGIAISEQSRLALQLLSLSLKDAHLNLKPCDDTTLVCVTTIKSAATSNNYITLTIVTDEYGGTNRVAREISNVAADLFYTMASKQLNIKATIFETAHFTSFLDTTLTPTQPPSSSHEASDEQEESKKIDSSSTQKRPREVSSDTPPAAAIAETSSQCLGSFFEAPLPSPPTKRSKHENPSDPPSASAPKPT